MNKVTINRELLERIDETAICDGTDVTISDDLFTQLVEALAAPRQAEGDELEKLATSAAQSAPAGEREAYEQWKANMQPYGFNGADAFQAGAAWQRTQAAGVPEGWRLVPVEPAPELFGRYLGRPLMNMDRKPFESWADEYRRIVAAAQAQPAVPSRRLKSE